MKIIVIGAGKIGNSIIKNLVEDGHDVTVIDNNQRVVNEVTDTNDVMVVTGNGADPETLSEANAQKADLVIGCTVSDELNMICCYLARRMGAKHTIARIRNLEYTPQSLGFIKHEFNLSMTLNPELLVAKEIYNLLKFPSAVKVEKFSRKNFDMIEIKLPKDSNLDGINLIKMRELYPANYIVCTVQRGEEVFIPDGTFCLQKGDRIGITAAPTEIQKLLKMLGIFKKQAKKIIVVGGGRTSYFLASMFEATGNPITIIDKDLNHCEELGRLLPNTNIIHADGTHQDALLEEGIESVDGFVALTGIDEQNILISMFAKNLNIPTVISKINREEMANLASTLGHDAYISPLATTTNVILRYIRALENGKGSNIETLYKLLDGKAEALEFKVDDSVPFIGIPLKDLEFKKNTIIAGIIRGRRKIIIPSGNDSIQTDDRVVVISAGQRFDDISQVAKQR